MIYNKNMKVEHSLEGKEGEMEKDLRFLVGRQREEHSNKFMSESERDDLCRSSYCTPLFTNVRDEGNNEGNATEPDKRIKG